MSATIQAATTVPSSKEIPERTLLLGLGLTSFAALLLELALTRLFSVVLFYHFAFLAISIALLGLGAGGVFACLLKKRLARTDTRTLAARLCIDSSILVFIALEVVLHVPVALDITGRDFLHLTALYVVAALPFFLTGVQFSVIFARETRRIPRLYAADLSGGALACLAVVPLLNWLGGPNTILAAAVVTAAAGMVWAASSTARRVAGGLAVAFVVLIAANHSSRLIDVVYAKGVFRDPSWVEFARWNALSRVEVDRQDEGKAIVIDADASTYIMNCDLAHWHDTDWEHDLMSQPPALANVLRPHGEFAIIGPGGGVDVLRALANGSPSVTGIEINPIIADTIMRGRYADYAQHLYERPEVHIHVTDGRSYLRSTPQQFDVVQMTLVDTWASTAAGAFALSENNLYTVEAFREYFQHLKPDGMIAITRWEFRQPREALRVVAVAMEALHSLGVADPARNFVVASQGAFDEDGIPVVVLAKKTAFTAEEESAVQAHFDQYDELHPLYLPSEPAVNQTGHNPFADLIASNDPYRFAQSYAYNVAPVTDNAPFFFFTLKAGQILGQKGLRQAIDWKVNLGVLVLILVLVISLAAVLGFLILPLALQGGRQSPVPLLYFVAVGLGYILVEIAFIQRFVLFLGHPTYALTVVIFLLMLSSGAGSLLSRRWLPRTELAWMPLVLVIVALVAHVFFLPHALAAWVGLRFGYRVVVSGMLLAPLGFVMGMPFPTGLRALAADPRLDVPGPLTGKKEEKDKDDKDKDNAVEWAWAMNAAASVLGSVLAMVIAIQFGLNVTLACGVAAYLLALLLLPALLPQRA
jgi:spermidine synthase